MRSRLPCIAAALTVTLASAGPGAAHPHVFVDAGLRLVFDDSGHLAAVRVVWVYDSYFSLLLASENGLVPDAQGAIPAEEVAVLAGRDVLWDDPDFHGDLYIRAGGERVALEAPREHTAAFVEGRYVTGHLRPLAAPLDPGAAPVVLQVYDTTYYVHYEIGAALQIEGRDDCRLMRAAPDLELASDRLSIPLSEAASARDIEAQIDDLGALFAEEIRLTCAG